MSHAIDSAEELGFAVDETPKLTVEEISEIIFTAPAEYQKTIVVLGKNQHKNLQSAIEKQHLPEGKFNVVSTNNPIKSRRENPTQRVDAVWMQGCPSLPQNTLIYFQDLYNNNQLRMFMYDPHTETVETLPSN